MKMLSEIRKEIIHQRLSLTKEDAVNKSNAINLKLNKLIIEYMESHADIVFLMYYPLDNEVDINQTARWLLEQKKQVYYPVSYKSGIMDFFRVNSLDELTEGRFHVMEPPQVEELRFVPESHPETTVVVLTPGVVFDRGGNRIGHGMGYYDRYFEGLHKVISRRNIIKLGIAYGFQIIDRLQTNPWDIPVDEVISEI